MSEQLSSVDALRPWYRWRLWCWLGRFVDITIVAWLVWVTIDRWDGKPAGKDNLARRVAHAKLAAAWDAVEGYRIRAHPNAFRAYYGNDYPFSAPATQSFLRDPKSKLLVAALADAILEFERSPGWLALIWIDSSQLSFAWVQMAESCLTWLDEASERGDRVAAIEHWLDANRIARLHDLRFHGWREGLTLNALANLIDQYALTSAETDRLVLYLEQGVGCDLVPELLNRTVFRAGTEAFLDTHYTQGTNGDGWFVLNHFPEPGPSGGWNAMSLLFQSRRDAYRWCESVRAELLARGRSIGLDGSYDLREWSWDLRSPFVVEPVPMFFAGVRETVTLRRLCLLKLTLHAYALDHGVFPEGLDALVPGYLLAVPSDPRTGRMFWYKRLAPDRYQLRPAECAAEYDHGRLRDEFGNE